jgi:hypothetical protein
MKALLNQLFAALCSPTIFKMVSFAMIGVANALVDFGVFAVAYKLLERLSGISTCETELAG